MKTCGICLLEKDSSEYYKHPLTKDRLAWECKSCQKIKAVEWRKANPKKFKENHRKYLYGINEETYQILLENQGGLCAICRKEETMKWKGQDRPLSVDHCHNSKEVRGLLCGKCNRGLGCFNDDFRLLQRALNYLEKG